MVDEELETDHSFDVTTIKELIRSALDNGKSVRELAADSGHRVKFQTFQELSLHPPKQFPKDPKTITGMALALKVSETAIVLAYARSLGITVTTGSNLSLRLPADVDRLTAEMQDAIVNLTRAALNSGRVSDQGEDRSGIARDVGSQDPRVNRAKDGKKGHQFGRKQV